MNGVKRMSNVQSRRVEWLWEKRLPLGKIVTLDGMPGLGKSTMTLDITARVSTGRPMPGATTGRAPANVVLMSAEDGIEDTIKPRLDAAGADTTRIVVWDSVTGNRGDGPPVIPDDLDRLQEIIEEERARLVVIDPLFAFLSGESDSYRDQDIRRVLHRVKMVAEATNACVIVVRHPTKGAKAGPAVYAGGGSVGIVGAARVGLVVGRERSDDASSILAVSKSNLAAIPESLTYRLVNDPALDVAKTAWEGHSELSADDLMAGPRAQKPRDDMRVLILSALATASERHGLTEIARMIGCDPKHATLRRALGDMVEDGDLDRDSAGTYARLGGIS